MVQLIDEDIRGRVFLDWRGLQIFRGRAVDVC